MRRIPVCLFTLHSLNQIYPVEETPFLGGLLPEGPFLAGTNTRSSRARRRRGTVCSPASRRSVQQMPFLFPMRHSEGKAPNTELPNCSSQLPCPHNTHPTEGGKGGNVHQQLTENRPTQRARDTQGEPHLLQRSRQLGLLQKFLGVIQGHEVIT